MSIFNRVKHDPYLNEYIKKSIELKLGKHLLIKRNNDLQLKKKKLEAKQKELDNINYSVWIIEDKFCNDVWDFSMEHNFSLFFDRHPENTEINNCHQCKYNNIINEDVCERNHDNKDTTMILKLKREIETFSNEIILIRSNNLGMDLESHRSTLNNLKSFSEEISELIRSITTLENSANMCNIIINQKSNAIEGFKTAKQVFKKSNFRDCILTEKKQVSANTTMINKRPTEPFNMQKNIKFGRFILKKRSLISIKFEQSKKIKIE